MCDDPFLPSAADPGHPPIKNEDLIEHVARLRADDSRGFSDEYDVSSF